MVRHRRRGWCVVVTTILCGTALCVLFMRDNVDKQTRQVRLGTNPSMLKELEEMSIEDFMETHEEGSVNENEIQLAYDTNPVTSQALLTLFTVMEDSESRRQTNVNTLLNWDALYPGLRPVLVVPYGDIHGSLPSLVQNLTKHWTLLILTARSRHPILQDMFTLVRTKTTPTPFIGYAVGDIVFDASILGTLEAVLGEVQRSPEKPLIIGRGSVLVDRKMGPPFCLRCLTRLSSKTRADSSLGYVFSTSGPTFPWDTLPRHMVGRHKFEDMLLRVSFAEHVTLIDATITLFAIRQVAGVDEQLDWFRLHDITRKTWPSHVRCPASLGDKCLPINITI